MYHTNPHVGTQCLVRFAQYPYSWCFYARGSGFDPAEKHII